MRDVQTWLNKLRETCQCCAQGRDARRPADRQRCCGKGNCCQQYASERTIRDAWTVLRSALSGAVCEELIPKNVAGLVRLPKQRRRRSKPWPVEEARRFLESARNDADPLYAAYVLILILGLRKGEVLGLPWSAVGFDAAELNVAWQFQRVRRELLHRETKIEASDTTLPLPDICTTALRLRQRRQDQSRQAASEDWQETGLVFTARNGSAIDPRNFNRSFETRCRTAGVRRITVHDTRHTCASLLAALDVHPRVAMRILRHAQISVTMEVYTEVSDTKTMKALKRLGRQFDL